MRHALAIVAAALLATATGAAAAPPIVPYRFTASTPARAAEVNANFQTLAQAIGDSVPTGTLLPFMGTTAPAGYVLCDGAEHPRTGATAGLFGVLGTVYGVGDGSTTFNVPDLRGLFLVGAGKNHAPALTDRGPVGATGGEEKHRLLAAESGMPAHDHPFGGGTPDFKQSMGVTGGSDTYVPGTGAVANAGNTGARAAADAASAHDTMPPFFAVSWIVKL